MKKLMFVIISAFSLNYSNAQEQIEIKTEGDDKAKNKIKKGNTVTFVLKGWNPFAVTSLVEQKNSDVEFSDNNAINALTVPSSTKDKTEVKKSDQKDDDKSELTGQEEQNKEADLASNFLKEYSSFNETVLLIRHLSNFEKHITDILNDPRVSKEVIIDDVQDYLDVIDTRQPRCRLFELLKKLDESYMKLHKEFRKLNPSNEGEINLKMKLTSADPKFTVDVPETKIKVVSKGIYVEEFEAVLAIYKNLKVDSVRNKILESVNRASLIYEKVQSSKFEVVLGPYQIKSDINTFDITLKNAKGEKLYHHDAFTVFGYGGWKVDVSSGYGISFIGDDSYDLVPDEDGKPKGVRKGTTSSMKHAIVALVHAYPKSEYDVTAGISAGVSIPVEGSINFYIGGSFMVVNKSRFVFTTGLSYVKAKRLNESNLNGKEFISSSNTEIKYHEVYKPAMFCALTYNITKPK